DNGLGLSGREIGTIYSVNSFVTILFLFGYGIIQDKLVIKRTLIIFCASMSVLVGPFFTLVYKSLIQNHFFIGVIVGSIFLSAGYAISALVAGHLFVIDPELNFWLGSLIALVLLLILIFWRSKSEKVKIRNLRDNPGDDAIPSARDFMRTLKMKHLWIVMLFI